MRALDLRGGDLLGLLMLAALAIGLGVLLFREPAYPLERSAVGSTGLVEWLQRSGIEARYADGQPVTRDQVGLRILPILDTDPAEVFIRPQDDAEFLRTGTERDIPGWILARKTDLLPTLLIAPKWTRAMRHSGLAHTSLLLDAGDAAEPLRPFGFFAGPLLRPADQLLAFDGGDGRRGLIYAPQLFPPVLAAHCESLLAAGAGHLVIRCQRGNNPPLYALSDPDLMNNHGLSLSDNAAIAAGLVAGMAGTGPVLVDTTDFIFTVQASAPAPARKWRDLLRLFEYPFSVAWAGLSLVAVLLLWRSWVRFGPPRPAFADRIGAAREVSIEAKARLLRMSGGDGPLLAAHVRNRLRRIERRLFGKAGAADPAARIAAHLERRDPAAASAFAAAAAAATTVERTGGRAPTAALLEAFETQARKVVDGA